MAPAVGRFSLRRLLGVFVLVGIGRQAAVCCDLKELDERSRQAVAEIAEGQFLEARELLTEVIGRAGECPQERAEWSIRAMLEMAAIDRLAGRPADGLVWAKRAAATAEAPGAGPMLLASTLEALAELQGAAGKFYDAEPNVRRAIEISQSTAGDNRAFLASCYNTLAVLHLGLADPEGAQRQVHRAIEYSRAAGAGTVLVSALYNLSHAAWQQGRLDEASQAMGEAIAKGEQLLGPSNPQLAHMLESYARLLSAMNRRQEARAYRLRARNLMSRMAR